MKALTIQIHGGKEGWLDVATLQFLSSTTARMEYDVDYAATYFGRKDSCAVSLARPVDLAVHEGPVPAFIFDLIPQGEPLRRLLLRHELTNADDYHAILSTVPLASPGNIRIKEPWRDIDLGRPHYAGVGFTRADITERHRDFIEYMESSGAPIGGTSGAGGGSPKFLLREDAHGRLHAEGWLDDGKTRRALLVKLPYSDSENSRMLARVEKIYYDILRNLPVRTHDELIMEGDALFIARFDRDHDTNGALLYYGLESLYSAHGLSSYGMSLRHEDNIKLICAHSSRPQDDVVEYLKRDVLNRLLANTDNHGRNTSFIKRGADIRLSPLYDVTAMQFFTGDIITELTRWDHVQRPLEARLDWLARETSIARKVLLAAFSDLASATGDLERRMRESGVPADIIGRSRAERDRMQREMEDLR